MSDLTSGNVLTGYIPAKFGDRLVHIDAAHPLASQLVASLPRPRTAPVITIEGGEYDGQRVDLNDVTLDYAMAQLGARYDLVGSVDGFSPARIVAKPDPIVEHLPASPVTIDTDADAGAQARHDAANAAQVAVLTAPTAPPSRPRRGAR